MKKSLLVLAASMALTPLCAWKAAVLTDIHVTPGNRADSTIRVAVEEINASDLDMVIVSGDLTNEGADAELHNIHSILSQIKHPMAVIPGNHENNWSQSAGKTFIDLWGNDRFAVTFGDTLAVVGINCGPYMKMGDGHIKQEDLHWLRHTLDSLCSRPQMKVLSVNHYPIRKDDLDNYLDYASLLSEYPVLAHINGHYHHWQAYKIGDINAAMLRALAMKDGSDGYSLIEIDPQWIHIYEKVLGHDPTPRYAFAVRTRHKPIEAQAIDAPQVEGFEITRLWADSASVFTRLGIDDRALYFGTSTGMVKAIDRESGRLLWNSPVGGSVYSRPVPSSKWVAVPFNSGIALLSKSDAKRLKLLPSAQAYVADGLIHDSYYLQGGYKRFEARRADNGKLLWCYDSLANYCQAAPAVDGDDVIFGAWDTALRCLSLRDGSLKWRWTNGKSNNLFSPGNVVPVIAGDKVIIVAPDRYITAIDRSNGHTMWRDNSYRYRESLGSSADGTRVYAKTMDGQLVAVSATAPQFEQLWCIDMGLGYEHAPCVIAEVDGVVYAGSRRGLVTAVDVTNPLEPRQLWSLPLGSSEINAIDIAPDGSTVYVSLIEGSIWKIRRKLSSD